jgi:predicted RND superfamily exporter protein
MSGLAAILVPPMITALLTAAGVWWKDRRTRRDLDHERRRLLQQTRDQIDTIEAWVKAYDLVVPPDLKVHAHTRAQNDLEGAYVRLSESLSSSRGIEHRTTFIQHLKTLLMIGMLQTRPAKAARLLYYLALCFAAVWASVGSVATIGGALTVGNVIAAIILVALGSVLLPWGIYRLVIRFDHRLARGSARSSQGPAFPPSS